LLVALPTASLPFTTISPELMRIHCQSFDATLAIAFAPGSEQLVQWCTNNGSLAVLQAEQLLW
jgi:hypothetical protein